MRKVGDDTSRSDALKALSAEDKARLTAFAIARARPTDLEPTDLLNAAMLRWLESDVQIGDPQATTDYLFGAINSERSNWFKRQATVRKKLGDRVLAGADDERDPLETVAVPGPSAEDAIFVEEAYALCAGDPDVQSLILYDAESTPRTTIQAETGWNNNQYEAVRKRRLRLIVRLKIEGKL